MVDTNAEYFEHNWATHRAAADRTSASELAKYGRTFLYISWCFIAAEASNPIIRFVRALRHSTRDDSDNFKDFNNEKTVSGKHDPRRRPSSRYNFPITSKAKNRWPIGVEESSFVLHKSLHLLTIWYAPNGLPLVKDHNCGQFSVTMTLSKKKMIKGSSDPNHF